MNIKGFILLIIIFFQFLISTSSFSEDEFEFDVTEIEILEEGNLYKGIKKELSQQTMV